MSSVHASALTVRFGSITALDAVDFVLEPGTSTALVGANGSGKSTLLNVLAGLQTFNAGTLDPRPDDVAYVLQHTARRAWMPLTVGEVLRMGRYRPMHPLRRLSGADRAAIRAAAARLDISDLESRQFGELSGGQRQRVLVAQAIARDASLLLMDEPITGLDLPSQERILRVIDDETGAGHTVVISTHHLEEAHHCDQVLVLANRLVAAGQPAEVLRPEVLRAAYDHLVLGAHEGHDHPVGVLWLDDHAHGHTPHGDS